MTERPQRKSPRLPDYNYASPGAYFVTICTHNRLRLFGCIENETIQLTVLGNLAYQCWSSIPEHYPMVELDNFIVMPNHMHGLIFLKEVPNVKPVRLGMIVGSYKAAVTRQARLEGIFEETLWQARYHDHIVRNEKTLAAIREYIVNNPLRWEQDTFYSE